MMMLQLVVVWRFNFYRDNISSKHKNFFYFNNNGKGNKLAFIEQK